VSIVCRACKFCRRRAKTSANLLLLHWRTALCAIAAVPLLQWRLGPLARRASLSLSVWRATRARRPGPTLSGCTRRPLRRGPTMENRSNCCKRDDKSINQWAPHPGWLHARSGSCAQPGRALMRATNEGPAGGSPGAPMHRRVFKISQHGHAGQSPARSALNDLPSKCERRKWGPDGRAARRKWAPSERFWRTANGPGPKVTQSAGGVSRRAP